MRSVRLTVVAVLLFAFCGSAAASAAPRRSAGLQGAEARQLAERTFPTFLGRSTGAPAPLSRGLRIAQPLSDHMAKLETASGRPAGVAEFTQPIATGTAGHLSTVDLDLVGSGGRLKSRKPAVDVRYPRHATGSVSLPHAGVSFRAAGSRRVRMLSDRNELFFPDALSGDVDYALVPKAEGVETLWQLRSAASRETLRLQFTLPSGARLRKAPVPGGAEVVGADGSVLAVVKPPIALDARRSALRVTTRVAGRSLVYRVAHRGHKVAYPILVDPTVAEYWNRSVAGEPGGGYVNCGADNGLWSSGAGAWTYGQSIPAGSTAFLPACDMRQFGWGYGLYVLQYANSAYVNGATGLWLWVAPTDAYISGVYWLGLGHRPGNNVTGNTTLIAGIGNVFVGWNAYREIDSAFHMDWYEATGANHSASQSAITGLRVNGNGQRSIGAYSRLDGAVVYLNDDYNPTVTLTGHVPGNGGPALNEGPWFDPELTVPKVRLSLGDRGLGVWNWAVVRNDTGGVLAGNAQLPCFGTHFWHCPNSYDTGTVNYNAGAIPEGVTAVHAVGWDAQERSSSSPSWNLRVDRTGPAIAFSGAAYDQRGGLADPTALVRVTASDGSTASAATQRSGVKTLNVYADGQLLSSTGTLPCPGGSCPAVLDTGIQSLGPGDHTISATATDQLGHSRTSSFTLTYYATSAVYGGANRSIDTEAEALTVADLIGEADTRSEAADVWAGVAPADRDYVGEILPDDIVDDADFPDDDPDDSPGAQSAQVVPIPCTYRAEWPGTRAGYGKNTGHTMVFAWGWTFCEPNKIPPRTIYRTVTTCLQRWVAPESAQTIGKFVSKRCEQERLPGATVRVYNWRPARRCSGYYYWRTRVKIKHVQDGVTVGKATIVNPTEADQFDDDARIDCR